MTDPNAVATIAELAVRYGVAEQVVRAAIRSGRAGRPAPAGTGRPRAYPTDAFDEFWRGTPTAGEAGSVDHGTPTMYRYGCRCPECRTAHAADTSGPRREARFGPGGPMGPKVREKILRHVRGGRSVVDAAGMVGVNVQSVYGAARALPEFREALDEATAVTHA